MNKIVKYLRLIFDRMCYNQDHDDHDIETETSQRLAGRHSPWLKEARRRASEMENSHGV